MSTKLESNTAIAIVATESSSALSASLTTAVTGAGTALPADKALEVETKSTLKARTGILSTFAVSVAVTDVEQWLAAHPNASARDRRIAERARDAFRRKLGEK